MLRLLLTSLTLALAWGAAFAQVPTIGVYTDETGTNCNLIDNTPGVLSVYVVITAPFLMTAVEFSAPKPPCFNGTYISDELVFLSVGNSQTGISVALPGCYPSPTHILTINYFAQGNTPPCCFYPVLPAAGLDSIPFVSCDFLVFEGLGLDHTINGNDTCFCGIDPAPAVPSDPWPLDGSVAQLVTSQLAWESSDPLDDPLTYDVYFGTNADPAVVAVDHLQKFYNPGILDFAQTYYWKITVKDDKGNETEGPVWSFTTTITSSHKILVPSVLNYCGLATTDTVRVDLKVENSLIPIDTGGCDVTYDATDLTFIGCERGSLTAGWQVLDCVDYGTCVRVNGLNDTWILPSSSGSFARLLFVSNCCGIDTATTSVLCVENTTGDLKSLWPRCGDFTCGVFAADGDVNGNGIVSPADALCAFESYLSFPAAPASGCGADGWDVRSDVDCNEEITPADALCIFEHWLDGSCSFCESSPAPPSPASLTTKAAVTVRDIRTDDGFLTMVVGAAGVPLLNAFGFEVHFPAAQLQYAGIKRSGATTDFDHIGGFVYGNGLLRAGGYCAAPVAADEEVVLLELRFRTLGNVGDGTVVLQRYVDALRGAETVTVDLASVFESRPVFSRFVLYQNHPNPFNPATAIRYEIPDDATGVHVNLTIFNIEGKVVLTLVSTAQTGGEYSVDWDGRNGHGQEVSSGVYFYVLKAGGQILTRKMVLLR